MYEYRLPHSATSVPTARRLAEEAAPPSIAPRMDDFVLIVSEAVANAVRHAPPMADGQIGLRFETDEGCIRGVVTDGGSSFVRDPRTVRWDEPGLHFGLSLIDALSSRWGITVDGVKNVWFEVEASASDSRFVAS
jgi:anti-sigma regulatory factor (Ser/Thr protein kinase)